jgi:hypothetical protein
MTDEAPKQRYRVLLKTALGQVSHIIRAKSMEEARQRAERAYSQEDVDIITVAPADARRWY